MDQLERALPTFLRSLHTDEWRARPRGPRGRRLRYEVSDRVVDLADERQLPKALAAATQQATAIGLRALNREWGSDFFQVPEEAERNEQVAIDTFRVGAPIIDVQTHFLAPHSAASFNTKFLFDLYQSVMPNWWSEMHDIEAWSFAEYLRNVFVESETAVAVLTSGPGVLPTRNLFNDEMHAAKILVDGAGARGRVLNHAVVHADDIGEVGRMAEWRDEFHPVGWKVYTPGRSSRRGWVGPAVGHSHSGRRRECDPAVDLGFAAIVSADP